MRISDWSSDVCSSDLLGVGITALGIEHGPGGEGIAHARAKVEITVGRDVADAEAFEVAVVQLGLGGGPGHLGLRPDDHVAHLEAVTGERNSAEVGHRVESAGEPEGRRMTKTKRTKS